MNATAQALIANSENPHSSMLPISAGPSADENTITALTSDLIAPR